MRSVAQVITSEGTGSAFYIGNDEWLPAAHVVSGITAVLLKSDIVSLSATVVGADRTRDSAHPAVRDTLGERARDRSGGDSGRRGVWVIGSRSACRARPR